MATLSDPIVKFKTRAEHYIADACVVWCYDDRFYKLLKAFGKKQGFKNIDLVKIAGGAKALATEEATPDRDFVINQIKTSVRLHGTKRVVLMLHRDCGAYGGSKSFENPEAERAHYESQLRTACDFVKKEVPAVPVDAYFADFDGLYLID
jgi:carbonic anhydrase